MKTGIRIFVDAHVFDGEFQGTRTFIRGIYSILGQKPGIQLYFGANDIENLKKNFPQNENTGFIQYKTSSGLARLMFEIPSIIKKYRIDFAHFQYFVPPVRNCKFIVTTHDVIFNEYPEEFSWWYRVRKNFLYRISALRADIITTVSGYSKKSIQKYLGIRSKEIYITPNGVGSHFFEEGDRKRSQQFIMQNYGLEKLILYVSRIEPRKNHALLLKAFLELELYQRGYYLVLLGHETTRTPEFDRIMDRLPAEIKKFIWINGDVSDEVLVEFYRAATVFVYPSKAEGFGIPPLEAAALKTPVLCSCTSAMDDFDFFGEDLFDPLNYDEFKKKLRNAIDAPHDEAYLRNLSELIRQNYTWERSAEKLYEIILK